MTVLLWLAPPSSDDSSGQVPLEFNAFELSRAELTSADAALVARLRAGEELAFDELYLAHYADLHRFAWHLVRSRESAEDLVHDVFALVWERRATLDVQSSLRGYLFGLMRHRAVSFVRHARVEERIALDTAFADTAQPPGHGTPTAPADTSLEGAELDAELRRVVGELTPQRREVLLLRWDFHMTYVEIAHTLGISAEAARAHGSRAGRVLRAALERFLER